jgi:lipoate-protein ligase A
MTRSEHADNSVHQTHIDKSEMFHVKLSEKASDQRVSFDQFSSPRIGSYKQIGGKLVNARVMIDERQGTIERVHFDGDYSLETEDKTDPNLDFLESALAGVPIMGSHHVISSHALFDNLRTMCARVLAAHPHLHVIGMDADGFAAAVVNAATGETVTVSRETHRQSGEEPHSDGLAEVPDDVIRSRWNELGVWLLDLDQTLAHPLSPAMQMALDEVVSRETQRGELPPLIRFWQWSDPAVIIGMFQSLHHEVNVPQARREGVRVVRRITGGGAMFVEPGNTITYSLTAPLSFIRGLNAEQAYILCESWMIRALRSQGIDARHVPLNDIASSAGKIGGAAQRRFPERTSARTSEYISEQVSTQWPGAVLHHTTMAYDIDAAKMNRILTPARAKLAAHAVKSAAKRVDPIRSQSGVSRETLMRACAQWLEKTVGVRVMTGLPADIMRQAHYLARVKFSNPAWTGRIQ